MDRKKTGKYICKILRHAPETIGIKLDEHGWARIDELIEGVSRTHPITREELEELVRTDDKQRYSMNEDRTLIRANQGHSIPVDVELEKVKPPEYLYHGTGEKYLSSIEKQGLIPKNRLYVHLSGDIATALKVGSRHGKPAVYRVAAGRMAEAGFVFYRSVNGVWLTKAVPVEFLTRENGAGYTGAERTELVYEELTEKNYDVARFVDRSDVSLDFVGGPEELIETLEFGRVHGCIGHAFAVSRGGRYIATILLGEALLWETDPPEVKARPFYRLMFFTVDRAFRGRGLGSEILEETIARVRRDFGDRPIVLGVHKDNPSAARFYERHGFSPTEYFEGDDRYYLRYE